MKKILLTFDLEYWFESLSIQKYLLGNEKDEVATFINNLLNLLKQTNSTATFFVTKKVLDKEPNVVKQISNAGHEIAVHSSDHKPLWDKNPEMFNEEIKQLISQIESLIDKKPIGHRAVNFSLNKSTEWSIKVLKENNLKYDSSILPLSIKPNLFNIDNFKEIKVFSGGFYIRAIPWFLFKTLLKNKTIKKSTCLYFHPFDFATEVPNIKMTFIKKFLKYYNTKNTWKKLQYIVKRFDCVSIEKYLYEDSTN